VPISANFRFNVKDDVSSSTSLKSSVQRHIRSSLLSQLPLLSQPAYKDPSAAPTSAPGPDEVDDEDKVQDDQPAKGSKKKGGKGKGKSKGKEDKDKEDEEGDSADLTVLDEIWPKKEALGLTKWSVECRRHGVVAESSGSHDRISIYTIHSIPLFFNHFDGPFIPNLKLLHQCKLHYCHTALTCRSGYAASCSDRSRSHQVPLGGEQPLTVRSPVLLLTGQGANMMAPGLLSPGGRLPEGLAADQIVAIHAEGKEHACGIGKMSASSEDIRSSGKGVAVEVLCWIG
jgi:PUA domain protein